MTIRFGVSPGQVEVEHIDTLIRWRDFAVLEIETRQKYCEVHGCSDLELMIGPSERTRPDSYDPGALLTFVHFPPEFQGWEVLPASSARYTIRVALYRDGTRDPCDLVTIPVDAPRPWDGRTGDERDGSAGREPEVSPGG